MLAFFAATLVLGSGCTKQDWIDRTLVTVDVTGSWRGTIGGALGNQELWLDLEQTGSKVGGSQRLQPDQSRPASGPIEGSVSGDVFSYKLVRGSLSYDLTVSATRQDEIAGIAKVELTLQPTFSIDFIKVTMVLE